jgi:o-succinylbenzoate synthase
LRILDAARTPYECPFTQTYRTATATHETREGDLVHLATDAGVLGLGEAAPLSNRTPPLAQTRRALDDALARLETRDGGPEQALADLDALAGEARAARFGLSLALEDALARDEQVPLADHLGDRYREDPTSAERVPVNATIPDASVDETRERARQAAADGYDVIKLKAGREEGDHDVERLEAVDDAAPEARIRLDVNGAWSSLEVARRSLERLAGFDLELVEQPLPADELQAMARLRNEAEIPIAADEPARDPASARATILSRCCDVLVVKPMVLGGVDRALEIAELAHRETVDVVVTTTIDTAVARAGALHVAAALPQARPHGLATGWMLADEPASFDERIEDGHMLVPEIPGHGARRSSGGSKLRHPGDP